MNQLLALDIVPIGIIVFALAVPIVAWLMFRRKIGPESGSGWQLDAYSKNVTLDTSAGGSLFSFNFPDVNGVHRVWKPIKRFSGTHVSMTFEIVDVAHSGELEFEAEDLPATVGFYVGDARIYSNRIYRVELAAGRFTITVPLSPECWQTVDGVPCNLDAEHVRNFQRYVENPTDIGPCFGGKTKGWAHGAHRKKGSPPAKFRMLSFSA